MTLRGRITRLEGQSPARSVTGARERLVAYLDAIAARLPIGGTSPKATAADLKADLAAILHRPRP